MPLARPRRRTAGLTVAALAVIAAVVVGAAVAGGIGRSSSGDARGKGIGATAPAAAPTTTPAPPGSTPSSPEATSPVDPQAGDTYLGLRLPAGSAVVLRDDPPLVHPDPSGGAFGLTQQGNAFVTDPHQALLAVVDPHLPSTLDSCRSGPGPERASVPRESVEEGGRLCVHMVDGTVALVTLRQIAAATDPEQSAVIDVTVWRLLDQSAESDL